MCVVSMVYDHFENKIPWVKPVNQPSMPLDMSGLGTFTYDLQETLDSFKRASEAAKIVDEKTGQPDCVDPEKAKLEARVRELEALLNTPTEFVIVSGANLEPGRYRVIDGKLYKAVE